MAMYKNTNTYKYGYSSKVQLQSREKNSSFKFSILDLVFLEKGNDTSFEKILSEFFL